MSQDMKAATSNAKPAMPAPTLAAAISTPHLQAAAHHDAAAHHLHQCAHHEALGEHKEAKQHADCACQHSEAAHKMTKTATEGGAKTH